MISKLLKDDRQKIFDLGQRVADTQVEYEIAKRKLKELKDIQYDGDITWQQIDAALEKVNTTGREYERAVMGFAVFINSLAEENNHADD